MCPLSFSISVTRCPARFPSFRPSFSRALPLRISLSPFLSRNCTPIRPLFSATPSNRVLFNWWDVCAFPCAYTYILSLSLLRILAFFLCRWFLFFSRSVFFFFYLSFAFVSSLCLCYHTTLLSLPTHDSFTFSLFHDRCFSTAARILGVATKEQRNGGGPHFPSISRCRLVRSNGQPRFRNVSALMANAVLATTRGPSAAAYRSFQARVFIPVAIIASKNPPQKGLDNPLNNVSLANACLPSGNDRNFACFDAFPRNTRHPGITIVTLHAGTNVLRRLKYSFVRSALSI